MFPQCRGSQAKERVRHLTQLFIFCWTLQLPVRAADHHAGYAWSRCWLDDQSLSSPLFSALHSLLTHCRHGTDPSYSLGISMQNTGIWSRSSQFISLILVSLRQTLKDFMLVISVSAYASRLGTQDNGFPKTRSFQSLLSWRNFFWSSHNANIIAYSTSLKFNFTFVWQPGAWVSVQAIQVQVELVLECLPPPHTLVSTAYILAVAVCEDGKWTFVTIVPAEE